MSALRELLASDDRQTLEFFFMGLRDVSEPPVDHQELLYNASVLAHHAQVSTQSESEWPTPASLGTIFDHFVLDSSLADDVGVMENAGAQCLLLAGFFEAQMSRRHNIHWYAELGMQFFRRAADHEVSAHKARVLRAIAVHFELWRQCHARLSRQLRDQPFLLHPPAFRPPR